MPETLPNFSREQWEFIAVLHVLKGPVPISLIGHLAPVLPGPLFELISQSQKLNWLVQKGEDHFSIGDGISEAARKKLQKINTPDHLSQIVDRLNEPKMRKQVDPIVLLNILEQAGKHREAGEGSLQIADRAIQDKQFENAWDHLKQAAACFSNLLKDRECQALYIATVLKLSNLSFTLSKAFFDLSEHLHRALELSVLLDDQRSQALINLHLGCLNWFTDHSPGLSNFMTDGMKGVEELGDEDLLNRAAGFLGILYFSKGELKKAMTYFDRAEQMIDLEQQNPLSILTTPLVTPFFSGFCLAYLGDFHRAIGSLDFKWRSTKQQANRPLALALRAALGTVLVLIGREQQAALHLESAVKEAVEQKNDIAFRCAKMGLALKSMNEGNVKLAHRFLTQAFTETSRPYLTGQFASPWILEMLSKFERLGFESIPEVSYTQVLERIEQGINVHLKGVALRLKTRNRLEDGENSSHLLADLKKSCEYLEAAGDPVQLSKTLAEIARFELRKKNQEKAKQNAQLAWATLGGYADNFFPDDLRHLIEPGRSMTASENQPQEFLKRWLDFIEIVLPVENLDEIYTRVVMATNRFIGAERGGLFWFPKGKYNRRPEFRAGCNLSETIVMNPNFQPYMTLILKAFREKEPLLKKLRDLDSPITGNQTKHVFCMPVEVRGKIRGVLYHDTAYMGDWFNFPDLPLLQKFMTHFSQLVERVWNYCQLKEERNNLISQVSLAEETDNSRNMVFQSRVMKNLIKKVDGAAKWDATILILGASGSGKELLAHRIHSFSARRGKPFIVVDAATIPEGLIESELFGHEKGSFTGADRQKRGRIELSNQGTLFIDEVGELPPSLQVKLLRAIQEHNFNRVGGNKVIHSDFRLIAATNRDLEAEVKAGRFREDLYFRLNVIPFLLPPLKDRREDISILARNFLKGFTRKYNRTHLVLDAESEKLLKKYPWPGNVRELKNVIERAVLLSSDEKLELDLPSIAVNEYSDPFADTPTLDEVQRRYITHVLKKTNGKVSGPEGAAELLGIPRTTLIARMKKLGLQ